MRKNTNLATDFSPPPLEFRVDAIKKEITRHIQKNGFSRYAFFLIKKSGTSKPTIISNYPEKWLLEYQASNYHLEDPVIQYGLQQSAPFSWSTSQNNQRAETKNNIFAKSREHGLLEGYTFVLHDAHNNFSTLSLVNDSDDTSFDESIEKNKPAYQMLLIECHNSLTADNFPIKKIEAAFALEKLTLRENEILHWSSAGKTYVEIGVILAIGERTVKYHMKNIVKKLNVSNGKHAIFKAQKLGLKLKE
jgi:LuxR family quorum-sensing system transcriptional regulator ExpR